MSKPRRPPARDVHGLVLLDKPAGLSSNQALQRVRHIFRAAKAGHTGSLDPLATGLLPICLGEATKIAGLLLGASKAYRTVARLGATTDTDDADGNVLLERAIPQLDRLQIEQALRPFIGRISQRPPIYSALKQGGEALYRKARRGEIIEVPEREVEVSRVELLSFDPQTISLEIECGSGTYIRSIVRDLGEALGCGAHVVELRRLWVDPFNRPEMRTLEQLQQLADQPAIADGELALDACLLPIEQGLTAFPHIVLGAADALRLAQGQVVASDGGEGLQVVSLADGQLLGLADRESGQLRPRRLFSWAMRLATEAS